MKAYLIWLDTEFQKTHDIEDLVVLASKKDPSILELKDYGAELSSFAVEVAEKFESFVKGKIP